MAHRASLEVLEAAELHIQRPVLLGATETPLQCPRLRATPAETPLQDTLTLVLEVAAAQAQLVPLGAQREAREERATRLRSRDLRPSTPAAAAVEPTPTTRQAPVDPEAVEMVEEL